MADVNLSDLLKLYKTPSATEDPSVASRATLRRVISDAGKAFPFIKTRGFLTHKAIPEKDGDFHFYIETRKTADQPDTPMMTCEIQGMNRQPPDRRTRRFLDLFVAGELEVIGLLRAWPEHLRNSTQPHLFEIHPVLTIGAVGKPPLDFFDRVIWPIGEDPNEPSKSWNSVADSPAGLTLRLTQDRIVFVHPKKNFQKENYVHLNGTFHGEVEQATGGLWLTLHESAGQKRSIRCFAVEGTPCYGSVKRMHPGKYRVGGLGGLDLNTLTAAQPAWVSQLSPVLEVAPLR